MTELATANIASRRNNSAGVQTAWTARKGGSSGPFGGHATLGDVAAYFGFEEDASDSTGNYATGTLYRSPSFVSGKNGNCIAFLDSDHADRASWSPSITFSGGNDDELTASMWLYVPSGALYGDGKYILSSSDDSQHQFYLYDNKPGVQGFLIVDDALSIDTWHHVVVCWPGDNVTVGGYIVVDNDWAGRTTFDSKEALSISDIGATYLHVASDGYNGYLDELGFWNRKLTESEISDLYNSGSGLFYDS